MSMPTAPFDLFNLPPVPRGEPIWHLARLYPNQGEWNEALYFGLNANILVELSDGCLEFPAVPTFAHQLMMQFLFKLLDAYVAARGLGVVLVAPLPVHLWTDKVREPDIVFLRPDRARDGGKYAESADLVVEVVSEGAEDRKRDLEVKPKEYAQAGIAEYWIVDPRERRITVLTLDGKSYREHGVFSPGQTATSVLLGGFGVDVSSVFAAGAAGQQPTA
jgi:Uma2 family endonuclease